MNLKHIDLNLLVYLDVLLQTCSVTQAAESMGISQPAMSNGLRRLRELFGDPLLIRTKDGMAPTERARSLQPLVRKIVADVELAVEPDKGFDPATARRVFRLSVSDYSECTLLPPLLRAMHNTAPNITLDILTPSDVSYSDVEGGKVDLVINRFDEVPQSFHHQTIWRDSFSCMISRDNPIRDHFDLDSYLQASHVWVSKTGMGIGVGVEPGTMQQLGWVDDALARLGKRRKIRVYTRHYQAAMQLAEMDDLVITLPSKSAKLQQDNPDILILPPPFDIPETELKMAWSSLLQHNPAHQWLRGLIAQVASELD
ncbi:MAG: LysR family transcriptional regulator [Abyssibacter sp.]|uniref:LysR family transcriptional regulator n=1 Tax=Abyssibacter sp. TaxID=2320200 RepID=UPI002EBFB1C2|nr:LysR family transcriptional regulator [Pseudomonadota bacterium]